MSVCAVQGCKHNSKNSTCRKFRYPKFPFRKKIWCQLTRVDWTTLRGWDRVCSCHFGNEDPLPSIFPWTVKDYAEVEASVLTKKPRRGKKKDAAKKAMEAAEDDPFGAGISIATDAGPPGAARFVVFPGAEGRRVYRVQDLEKLSATRFLLKPGENGQLTVDPVGDTADACLRLAGLLPDEQARTADAAPEINGSAGEELLEVDTDDPQASASAEHPANAEDGSKTDPLYEALRQLGIEPIDEEELAGELTASGPAENELYMGKAPANVAKASQDARKASAKDPLLTMPEEARARCRDLLSLLQLKRSNQQKAAILALRTRLLQTALEDYREAYEQHVHRRGRRPGGEQANADLHGGDGGASDPVTSAAAAELLLLAVAGGGMQGARPPPVERASRGAPLTLLRPDPNTPQWEHELEGDLVSVPADLAAALQLMQQLRRRVLLLRGRLLERAAAEASLRVLLAESEARALRTEANYRHRLDAVFTRQQQSHLLGAERPLLWSQRDLLSAIELRSLASRRAFEYVRETLRIPLPSMAVVRSVAASNKFPDVTRRFEELRASRGLGSSQAATDYQNTPFCHATAEAEETAAAAALIAGPVYSASDSAGDESDSEEDEQQTQDHGESYAEDEEAGALIYSYPEDEAGDSQMHPEEVYEEVEIGDGEIYEGEAYAEGGAGDARIYHVEEYAPGEARISHAESYAEGDAEEGYAEGDAGAAYHLDKIELQSEGDDDDDAETDEGQDWEQWSVKRKRSAEARPWKADEGGSSDEGGHDPQSWQPKRPRRHSESSVQGPVKKSEAGRRSSGEHKSRSPPVRWRLVASPDGADETRAPRPRGPPAMATRRSKRSTGVKFAVTGDSSPW